MVEYVRKNRMKEKMDAGLPVSGMEMWLRDPRVVELMAQAGYDFFHIENEHIANDWSEIENYTRIADGYGMTTVFRTEQCFHGQVPVNQIIKALKCGVQVIKVPHVESAESARTIVEAVKYPPLGARGVATCDRSAAFVPAMGADEPPVPVGDFIKQSNDQTQIWALIESVEGVENIEEIAAVEGIDVFGFGNQDYAISAGILADSDPRIDAARDKVRTAVLAAGKHMYFQASNEEQVTKQYELGVRVFLMFVDMLHLNNKLREVSHWIDALPH